MNFPRVGVVGWLTSASMLLACSSDDTILALNVTSNADVGAVSSLHVTVTPEGEAPFETEFEPPSQEVDGGGTAIVGNFFRRIQLPEDWEKVSATVEVSAHDENDMDFLSASTTVTIEPEGAVAAYITLARPVPPEGGAGGEGGQGSAGEGSGGAPAEAGAGGTSSGGTGTEGGAPTTDAGAGAGG